MVLCPICFGLERVQRPNEQLLDFLHPRLRVAVADRLRYGYLMHKLLMHTLSAQKGTSRSEGLVGTLPPYLGLFPKPSFTQPSQLLVHESLKPVNTRQNLTVFRLATCCGLRVSELCGLKTGRCPAERR